MTSARSMPERDPEWVCPSGIPGCLSRVWHDSQYRIRSEQVLSRPPLDADGNPIPVFVGMNAEGHQYFEWVEESIEHRLVGTNLWRARRTKAMASQEPAQFRLHAPLNVEVFCEACFSKRQLEMAEECAQYDCPGGCGSEFWFSLKVNRRSS